MAMAASWLNTAASLPSRPINNAIPTLTVSPEPFILGPTSSFSLSHHHHHLISSTKNRPKLLTPSAVVEEHAPGNLVADVEDDNGYEERFENDVVSEKVEVEEEEKQKKRQARPCELYVCNLPRSSDIGDLMEMFKPHGTVFSVEVCRSPETGLSRGCGYVTMGSIASAKAAMSALDKIDVAGREVRVRFSVHMSSKTRNSEGLSSMPVKNLVYESPYRLYVGNLAWAVRPDALRKHFTKFGNVASARVLHDVKDGKNRAYGFVSFSSAGERDEAALLDGTEFCGRRIIIRGLKERA